MEEGDEEIFITKVTAGSDPLQRFHEDKPEDTIELLYEEIKDQRCRRPLRSHYGVKGRSISARTQRTIGKHAHKKLATSLEALSEKSGDMTPEQAEDTVAQLHSKMTNV